MPNLQKVIFDPKHITDLEIMSHFHLRSTSKIKNVTENKYKKFIVISIAMHRKAHNTRL